MLPGITMSVKSRSKGVPRPAIGKRFSRVGGDDDPVTEALELQRHIFADFAVVFDTKNGFTAAQHRPLVIVGRAKRIRVGLRQVDPERRTAALLAADLDAAAGLLDEAEHHAEPEPGALADILGREERIENPVANGLRDAGAGVGDVDDDIVAGALDADGDGLANRRTRRFASTSVSMPPSGIASRALMARSSSAELNCPRSTNAGQTSLSSVIAISICLPNVNDSNCAVSLTSPLMSISAGCSGCFLAKASRLDVSRAPRSAASLISFATAASCGLSLTPSARISIVPVITVSMLLNSCAMPPVSWPTASIFCAWINCSSARRFWLMSLMKLLRT